MTDKPESTPSESERQLAALERANAELSQFAYIVSHDLKAPLRAISNLSQWIEEDLAEVMSGETRNHMALLRGRVRRMEEMISGILEYSRIGRVQAAMVTVDVAALITEIGDMLGLPAGFRIEIEDDLPILRTPRLRLNQVLTNLIGNAVKHHHRDHGLIRIGCKDLGERYEFSVSDDGPGIAPEFHDKIFMIFQTLQPRDKLDSTGIGLTLVKKIVEELGGRIEVESQPGAGTTFRFTWPKEIREEPE